MSESEPDPTIQIGSTDTPVASAGQAPAIAASVAGRYTVLEYVGRGGMGSVARAYDAKLKREVALKRLHVRARDEEARTRMIREAQAMAQLSNPHVVAVYDVEADTEADADVLLVMEYIDGETLREWLSRERPWAEIVGAFVAAADGLLAAHRVGIVHRDFKPSNVLVGAEGETIKVADFGLAKLDETESSESPSRDESSQQEEVPLRESWSSRENLTEAGAVMGTPRYMAPEQHAAKAVDARADQYALCVALWEALNGTPPFDNVKAKFKAPPAWKRSEVPRTIVSAIERGLSLKPADRWPDLGALIEVLRPAEGGRANWPVAAGLLGVAVVGGAVLYDRGDRPRCDGAADRWVGVWGDARRAAVGEALRKAAPAYGDQVAARVSDQLDDFALRWAAAYTDACEATHVRSEQSGELLDLRMACLQRAQAKVEVVVEVLAEADMAMVSRADAMVADLPTLSHCADAQRVRATVPPPDNPQQVEQAKEIHRVVDRASLLRGAGRLAEAREALDALPASVDEIGWAPLRPGVLVERGYLLESEGDYDASVPLFREALELAYATDQWPAALMATLRLAHVSGSLMERPQQGIAYLHSAFGLLGRPGLGIEHEAPVYGMYGGMLQMLGDLDGAERAILRAIEGNSSAHGEHDWVTAADRTSLGGLYARQGRLDDAEAQWTRALADMEASLGDLHPHVAALRSNLGAVLLARARYAEATVLFREIVAQDRALYGEEHPSTIRASANLAASLIYTGQYAEAADLLGENLAILRERGAESGAEGLSVRDNYAIALSELGRYDEAIETLRGLLRDHIAASGEATESTSRDRYVLGDTLRKAGQLVEAERQLRESLRVGDATVGIDHVTRPPTMVALGRTLVEAGRLREGRASLEEAWAIIERDHVAGDTRAECAFALAHVLGQDRRDRERARTLAIEARTIYAEAEGEEGPRYTAVVRWLAEQG